MKSYALASIIGAGLLLAGIWIGMWIKPYPAITEQLTRMEQKFDQMTYFLTGK
jgi:hypothetical protein